jgi:hypothetical protein
MTASWSEARRLQRPLADGELEIVHRTALKYLPGVEGIPSGDPLRVTSPSKRVEPALMNILVFVTDNGTEAGSGPVLFLEDFATSSMPPHPLGLEWKYFARVPKLTSCSARTERRSGRPSSAMNRSSSRARCCG